MKKLKITYLRKQLKSLKPNKWIKKLVSNSLRVNKARSISCIKKMRIDELVDFIVAGMIEVPTVTKNIDVELSVILDIVFEKYQDRGLSRFLNEVLTKSKGDIQKYIIKYCSINIEAVPMNICYNLAIGSYDGNVNEKAVDRCYSDSDLFVGETTDKDLIFVAKLWEHKKSLFTANYEGFSSNPELLDGFKALPHEALDALIKKIPSEVVDHYYEKNIFSELLAQYPKIAGLLCYIADHDFEDFSMQYEIGELNFLYDKNELLNECPASISYFKGACTKKDYYKCVSFLMDKEYIYYVSNEDLFEATAEGGWYEYTLKGLAVCVDVQRKRLP